MTENLIFCYSGSGNCLDIAKNIAKRLGNTDIIMMRGQPAVTDARGAKRVGFVFPCHAGGFPGKVGEYIWRIQRSPDAYTFGVCSFAGYMGCGLYKLDQIIPLDYWAGVSHLSSCIWLMPPIMIPPLGKDEAQTRAEKFAAKMADDIYSMRRLDKRPPAMALNSLESKAWPMLSKIKAKKMTVSDACIGCGQCEKLCPTGNIKLINGKPQFGGDCIQCLSCLQYCPTEAINMGGVTVTRERYHNPKVSAKELSEEIIHID